MKVTSKTAKDKPLDSIFEERIKEKEQFLIIKNELTLVGIKIGKLIASKSDVKGWNITWGKDRAGLFWTVGDGWDVAALKPGDELKGAWEDFDLAQQLECNGINLEDED